MFRKKILVLTDSWGKKNNGILFQLIFYFYLVNSCMKYMKILHPTCTL